MTEQRLTVCDTCGYTEDADTLRVPGAVWWVVEGPWEDAAKRKHYCKFACLKGAVLEASKQMKRMA